MEHPDKRKQARIVRTPVRRSLVIILTVLGVSQIAYAYHQPSPAYVYVPNAADGTVSAVDLTTNSTAWTIQVGTSGETAPGAEAAHGIAASPDGRFVYAGDASAKALVIIDTTSRTVTSRIPLQHGVHGIDITPDGNYVWVGGSLPEYPWLSAVSVVNTRTREIEDVVSPGVGDASHFAITPDGREVWIASVTTNLIWIVDAAERSLASVLPLRSGEVLRSGSPEGAEGLIGLNEVAVSPDGRFAYAVGPEASIVYAIDVATRTVIATARAGKRAHGISVSPDGREVWVANRSGSVTVLGARTLEELSTIQAGEYANHVAFGPGGKNVYVSGRNEVVIMDAKKREIIGSIPVGNEPHELSLED